MPKHVLDPLIDRAEASVKSRKPREVWEELTRMATAVKPEPPLIGHLPDQGITFKGAKWSQSAGTQSDVFTFAGLRARLWRRSKRINE